MSCHCCYSVPPTVPLTRCRMMRAQQQIPHNMNGEEKERQYQKWLTSTPFAHLSSRQTLQTSLDYVMRTNSNPQTAGSAGITPLSGLDAFHWQGIFNSRPPTMTSSAIKAITRNPSSVMTSLRKKLGASPLTPIDYRNVAGRAFTTSTEATQGACGCCWIVAFFNWLICGVYKRQNKVATPATATWGSFVSCLSFTVPGTTKIERACTGGNSADLYTKYYPLFTGKYIVMDYNPQATPPNYPYAYDVYGTSSATQKTANSNCVTYKKTHTVADSDVYCSNLQQGFAGPPAVTGYNACAYLGNPPSSVVSATAPPTSGTGAKLSVGVSAKDISAGVITVAVLKTQTDKDNLIKALLISTGPVLVNMCTALDSSAFQNYLVTKADLAVWNFPVLMPPKKSATGVKTDHAVVIVGWGTDINKADITQTRDYFVVQNSFGSDWGDMGFFYLPCGTTGYPDTATWGPAGPWAIYSTPILAFN